MIILLPLVVLKIKHLIRLDIIKTLLKPIINLNININYFCTTVQLKNISHNELLTCMCN